MENTYTYSDGHKLITVRKEDEGKTIKVFLDPNGEEISRIEILDEEAGSVRRLDSEIPLRILEKGNRYI